MSGALVQLIATGIQDTYITSKDGTSLFKMKFSRYTNFAQAPKFIKEISGHKGDIISIPIESAGDLVNHMWIEGDDVLSSLEGAHFSLYIGGQKVDSYDSTFSSDIWTIYAADTYSKSQMINNNISSSNNKFWPLHFFCCDNHQFIPLVGLQYHTVEVRVELATSVSNLKMYANYVYLDRDERESIVNRTLEFLITQVQKLVKPLENGTNNIDITELNHPVKSLYWGYRSKSRIMTDDKFCFTNADMYLNGTQVFQTMSTTYFHSVQGYYNSPYGLINMNSTSNTPQYTRFYTYNFCMDASSYKPTGTCNFSRIDNAKLVLHGVEKGANQTNSDLDIYAVNYNILKIERGLAGVLFLN
jgi:hypothetical protein